MLRALSIFAVVLVGLPTAAQSADRPGKAYERAVVGVEPHAALVRPSRPLAFSHAVLLEGATPTYDRIFTGNVDPACGAPSNDSPTGDGVPYAVVELEVTEDELLEAVVNPDGTSVSDTVISLYCDPFDPDHPADNLVAFNDDASQDDLLSRFTVDDGIMLSAGETYWLVVSTYAPADFGTVQIDFEGATIVPVELQSFTVE